MSDKKDIEYRIQFWSKKKLQEALRDPKLKDVARAEKKRRSESRLRRFNERMKRLAENDKS